MNIISKDGLLYRDGKLIALPEADAVAMANGYTCAEQMVRALEDERGGLPSASGFERLVMCPGSPAAEALFPRDTESSEIAARGTAIHEALESGDDSALNINDKSVREKLSAIESEAISAWIEEFGLDRERVTVLRETRLWIRERQTLNKVASAKVDCAAICEYAGRALVIDAKSGFLDTTPSEVNWQLRVQAVSLWHEYNFSVTDIRAAISAGRLGKYDPVDYDAQSLAWSEAQIAFYVRNSHDPHAPRVPGGHCRYCRARGACPQATSFALLPAATTKAVDKETAIARVELLSPQELAFVYSRKALTEAIFKAVSDRMKGLLTDDLLVVGYELRPNAGMRSVEDVQQAFNILKTAGLCDDVGFRAMCSLPIGTVEETLVPVVQEKLKAAGEKSTVDAAKKALKDLLSPAITIKPKEPSLKPIKALKP